MRWISIIMALGMLVGASCARASEGWTLLSGFASIHERHCNQVQVPGFGVRAPAAVVEQCQSFNEANHGLGIRLDTGAWAGLAFGMYRNSINRNSVYLVREMLSPGLSIGIGSLHAGVLLGAVTGYNIQLAPVVTPELVMRSGQLEVALVTQLFRLDDAPRFAALQLRWRF
jgi:hypothetical protein